MIAIIDDDPVFARKLKKSLEKYYNDSEIAILYDFDEDFLNRNNIEVLFVDIELKKGKNGIDLASRYRREGNENVEIIFISTHENFEHDSHVAFPLYFIRKAHFRTDFIDSIGLLDEIKTRKEMPFILNNKIIKLMDVMYVESKGNNVFYRLKDGSKIRRRTKLSEVEEEIEKFYFARCHRSYLVNVIYVKEYVQGKELVLKNAEIIPTTESYDAKIQDVFMNYYINMRHIF